jgi:hypothetical protein
VTGYVWAIAPCLVCRAPFTFNPALVPSHFARDGAPVLDTTAPREPICRPCIERINAERARLGNPTWPIAEGAYEPGDELESL